jgi:3-hydroxyacyl-CoA dehydrogenase / enoyl-CoA hydratase / 3-hydroxybutyryl-CoA epimerase
MAADQAALTLDLSGDGVAWLVFDRPDSRVNLLTAAVLERLDALLDEIENGIAAGSIRAVIVRSGKSGTFIAGADVREIENVTDPAIGQAAAQAGQQLYRRLELLRAPTVAAIDGLCLGGGTELVLACGHRIASDRPETRIGLPEVRLGILPGFGGTVRLPRLIGLQQSLAMILTGSQVNARKAHRIGLVDEIMHPAVLYARAESLALEVVAGRTPRRTRRRERLRERLLDRTGPGRSLVLQQARRKVMKETRGHYPAPLAALDTIAQTVSAPLDVAFAREAEALGRLIVTDVSKNLMHVFHLMEGAKKAAPRDIEARPTDTIGVIGAGVMGGGIAQLAAANGRSVRLKDIRAEAIGQGMRHARELFDRAVKRRRMDAREADRAMVRIGPTLQYDGFARTHVVIEAVVERMDVKKSVLREVEGHVSTEAVLATNTSTLSVSEMQTALERPGNFCGMHFFNPVHRMPLVEVIRGAATDEVAVATVFALARALEKTPLIVNDGPGFLVNRVLSPYLNEAGFLLGEGASIESIDSALLDFGMPMGPLRLLDEVGLDVARHAAAVLHAAFGERMKPSPALTALAGVDLLGRKGGRGFYRYEGDREAGVNDEIYALLAGAVPSSRVGVPPDRIRERCLYGMINEAARTLEDRIVASAGDVDLGMITGTGFPPFRGGLLRWADTLGSRLLLERLQALEQEHGARFAPAQSIRDMAAAGGGFYG